MVQPHPLQPLIDQFSILPGIGKKSAQRLAFYILSLPEKDVVRFAEVMKFTKQTVGYCERCFNLSIESLCTICNDSTRDESRLCVVAEPKDILALEKTFEYKGCYHVLGGYISPMDGVHSDSLRIQELLQRLRSGTFSELILALNPTIEGDATVHYLKQCLEPYDISVTQLAYGLPFGGDIDYTDELTLQKAFLGRTKV